MLSDAVIEGFNDRAQYIALGEAFAPLLALWHERETLQNSSLMLFVDNIPMLSARCKGSSTVSDFGCVVHAVQLALASLSCRAWFEHVDSKANIADGGSRLGESCPEARRLGISLREVPLPPWPQRPLESPPSEWLGWFSGKENRPP